MAKSNYSKIYSDLTKNLPQKTKEVLGRRFGVAKRERETLESIGEDFGITRERVRQIEERGFSQIKEENQEVLDKIYKEFSEYFENKGGLKKEDIILKDLGGEKDQPYVFFLLTLGGQFLRVCEKKDFHSFWAPSSTTQKEANNILDLLVKKLKKDRKILAKKEFVAQCALEYRLSPAAILSRLEISKRIKENKEGKIGLIEWPEINPKGVKDKAFLVFRKEKKPLHFTEVADLIDTLKFNLPNRKTVPQTVHNELIRDPRFVLVGRGKYALREWGYVPGTVKDVILQVMQETKGPLDKEEIVKKVLSQRYVAANTILINLNDKEHFSKTSEGKYILRKTQLA